MINDQETKGEKEIDKFVLLFVRNRLIFGKISKQTTFPSNWTTTMVNCTEMFVAHQLYKRMVPMKCMIIKIFWK